MHSHFLHPSFAGTRTGGHPHLLLALEFLLYALLAAFMLHTTWLTWPDAYVDFSRELYLPWRVSQGDVLYRDLAYYFGPISVYVNAALFSLLGHPSIHALFALNFAFWIVTLLTLRALLRRIASPFATTLAVSSFILLFSFNRYTGIGNDNYLAPYSHELTRGFLLALLSLLSLDTALKKPSCKFSCLSGFLLGLVLFTKPEIALATVASAAVLLFWERGRLARDGNSGAAPPSVWPFAFGVLAAIVLVVTPFAFAFRSFSQAFRHAFLNLYLDCFNPALASLIFYKKVLGTDAIFPHVFRLISGGGLAAAPFILSRLLLPRIPSRPLRLAGTSFLVLVTTLLAFFAFAPLNAALFLAPVALGSLSFLDCVRSARVSGPEDALHPLGRIPSPALALAFAAFSLVLASKMALNCGIWHYGFLLCFPAFCCAVLLAFREPCPSTRSALAMALLLGFSAAAFRLQHSIFRNWDVSCPVHDASYLAPRHEADAFNAALDWIRANTAPSSTLAVLPEGAILNVLSGRPNPTPYVYLSQGDWLRFGEPAVLAAYSNSPPDTLVLVRKLETGQFGTDYAKSLMSFLDPLYTPALTLSLTTPTGPVPYLLVATRIPTH